MASTYTTDLRLEKMANGENSTTWGTKTNTNWDLMEQAVAGVANVAMTDAEYTLTTSNAAADEARNAVITMTGTLTGTQNVIVPSVDKCYTFKNSTTGGFSIVVKTSAGTGVTVLNGETEQLYCDATNVLRKQTTPTGSGAPVRATSPTLVTPVLGVATATSINGSTIPSSVTLGTTLGTEQASTSGTAIDFTSIPSWAKQITIMFENVSVNGTGYLQVQIGDSGGIETSGYTSFVNDYSSGVLGGGAFLVTVAQIAALGTWGTILLSLKDSSGNTWTEMGVLGTNGGANSSAGVKSLTGTLDRLRVSTTAGDTFDLGSINISYSP